MKSLLKKLKIYLVDHSSKENNNIPKEACSPHLTFVHKNKVFDIILDYKKNNKGVLHFLDVGGRQGKFARYAKGFEYNILDIDESLGGDNIIHGDICHCPQILNNHYDIVFSNNVFEHLKEPWLGAEECVRITRPGGLLIHLAPFAWRYHPIPVDYFRYSHTGIKFLFERTGKVETIISGYDISERRKDYRGGKLADQLDTPPIDEMGGWRENWITIFVGRKIE